MSGASAMFDDSWFGERRKDFSRNVGAEFAAFTEERYQLQAPWSSGAAALWSTRAAPQPARTR
jgi:hypothetical protein